MIQYHFDCRLFADVVVTSSPSTEGFPESLDYLPGAKFLGIAASTLYDESKLSHTLDLFHNGNVCFGDAHPLVAGERCLKMPLSWSINKGEKIGETDVYQHHSIENHRALVEKGIQLKQLRNFYFQPKSGEFVALDQTFRIKSAYDTNLRRSEDEKMYGYYALPAGSVWRFTVSATNNEYLDLIKNALIGIKRIGRSRSAEYGLVNISFVEKRTLEIGSLTAGLNLVYADSAICLPVDFDGSLESLFPEGAVKINYAKSQIRTRIYQTWNGKRHALDPDRLVLTKGSVIALEIIDVNEINWINKGIGDRKAEGFGKIIMNPSFFSVKANTQFISLSLKKSSNFLSKVIYTKVATTSDKHLINLLKKRKNDSTQQLNIDVAVNKFIADFGSSSVFRKTTASQWGTIRSLAKMFPNKKDLEFELFNNIKKERGGYLEKGIAEEQWRTGKEIIKMEVLGNTTYPVHIYLQKIAAEMAKLKNKKKSK